MKQLRKPMNATKSKSMKRVYYIGDWAVQIGPIYAETSFNHAAKGLDFINYGHWLMDAIQSSGEFQVTSVPTWDFYNLKPGEYEKILATYDIVVFSDVEAKNFQLHPQFFNRHLFGTKVLTFPDRVKLTVDAVKAGHAHDVPGRLAEFQRRTRQGRLGAHAAARDPAGGMPRGGGPAREHRGFPGGGGREAASGSAGASDSPRMPPILGFNRVKPREGCPVIARWKDEGDPAIAVGPVRQGPGAGLHLRSRPALGLQFRVLEAISPALDQCLSLAAEGCLTRAG